MTPEQQTPASVVERLRENLADSNPSRLVCVESGDLQSVLDAVERLSAEREGLREALEPFDRFLTVLDSMGGNTPRSGVFYAIESAGQGVAEITVEDLRRARAALTQGESRAPTPADGGGE